ncbi:tissue factor pathway inhibitor isoform X2 [Ochotona princeps]|uniref:tissue factor pathway inhibitor isoform X2 n=1 Tax=Ochotona princeps TaxID=9978 RepID=UPI0027152146|nr:tissue factor pathway inhibitor isoform X2 [Ochotona princeps]
MTRATGAGSLANSYLSPSLLIRSDRVSLEFPPLPASVSSLKQEVEKINVLFITWKGRQNSFNSALNKIFPRTFFRDFTQLTYNMKKEHILWTSICLLLAVVPVPVDSALEEDEEFTNITDMKLPPLKPVQTFCAMKVDDGPCRAFIKRYFFNMLTHQCEEFIYGGCEGNENRFVTLEECKENCVRDYSKMTTKLTLQKGKPDFCFLEEDPGICRGYITRYFYNNQSKQCERFKYGGCLGNLNNFESLEECKSTCEDPDNTVQRNEISAVNDTLGPQPTKASRLWVTQETTNGGWKNADHTYQVFLIVFFIHASMLFLGLDSIL